MLYLVHKNKCDFLIDVGMGKNGSRGDIQHPKTNRRKLTLLVTSSEAKRFIRSIKPSISSFVCRDATSRWRKQNKEWRRPSCSTKAVPGMRLFLGLTQQTIDQNA